MRYVLPLLAMLALSAPAYAGSHHSQPGPKDAARADASVARLHEAIATMQAAGNPNPKVLDHLQNGLLPAAEARALDVHERCGC